MCKICNLKPVYEFTNQRKLCKNCFVKYFQKKFLYTNRKFGLIRNNEAVYCENSGDFRSVVLEDVLNMFEGKGDVRVVKLPSHLCSQISNKQLIEKSFINNSKKFRARRGKLKIAIPITTDLIAYEIINKMFFGDLSKCNFLPINKKVIKPLYLFLDEEVLIYSKIKKLKFNVVKEKKDKITEFIDELEKKHPEVKRAVVNSYLKINYL